MSTGVLLLFHCRTNTGYAIGSLERAFHSAALKIVGNDKSIFYGYSSLDGGLPTHTDVSSTDILEIPYFEVGALHRERVARWIRKRRISHVLAFDLPVSSAVGPTLRRAGVSRVVSYWGASISSIYPWYLRPLRRVQFLMSVGRPDHFIFESEGMRERAVLGAGIPFGRTSVVALGVDTDRFSPRLNNSYAHERFGIPPHRQLVFFSGHMEQRKGVHILIEAFGILLRSGRTDVHLVLAGNQAEDMERLAPLVDAYGVRSHVSFVGYRSDIAEIHRSASIGVIASTEWDSFTMSAVEMAASGLPLIVSDLPGLREAVVPGVTGYRVPPGRAFELSQAIGVLLDSPQLRLQLGARARERAISEWSTRRQVDALATILSSGSSHL